ncbi:BTB/POZ domain-containing protein KCTD21 isoform X1 [Cebus imitator]|uniref:BTB/POZ domain-containing protein KCTD21 isoform X1 n=1 Tax=Cebus imitator TaxID=2715852 RepID=UPI00189A4DEC|nr:BTB/POZ domain-containing protein KCTD21 isoform X1 [Cebus imitator]
MRDEAGGGERCGKRGGAGAGATPRAATRTASPLRPAGRTPARTGRDAKRLAAMPPGRWSSLSAHRAARSPERTTSPGGQRADPGPPRPWAGLRPSAPLAELRWPPEEGRLQSEGRRTIPAPQSPAMSDPITLNVGGKLYTTSLATLTSFPDSMLGAMFSGKMPTKRDSQGNCFIDRDGKVFRYILNFLRTSHLDLPEDFQEMGLLRREADFYQVQPLIEALQEKEVELSKAEKNAMLNITLNQRVQTVHFTVREAPQIYSLSSSSMEVFNANIFSTSCLFLKLLGSKLFYCSNGNLSSITSHLQDPNHLTLDWVANVEGLPEEEYTKQNLKRLWVVPANKQINSFQVFVEEVLKIALSDGFCIDSSHPHALDFMNNKIIRLIRYR